MEKSDGQEYMIQPVFKSDFYKQHQDKDQNKERSKEREILFFLPNHIYQYMIKNQITHCLVSLIN